MAAFSALTADQQAQVLAYMNVFRPTIGKLAQALNQVAEMDSLWANNVSAIVATLDANTPIPDHTGLAGAITLDSTGIQGLMTATETLLGTYNSGSVRTNFANIAGFVNIV